MTPAPGVPDAAVPNTVAILDAHPDLIGVLALADAFDMLARWSA